MNQEMFVVQRCWHSGRKQYQPMDYLRLFHTQRDAEEAAYHSAHAWSRHHNPNGEASVRTLLLPKYPSYCSNGTSYGFIAQGSLFWVRGLSACVILAAGDQHEGHAVITEGVIGGTGNKNSRRGTEETRGRVFVGGANNHSRMMALQACHKVMASNTSRQNNTYVRTMPIGKPDYVDDKFLQDWPPQVLQPNLLLEERSENKRETASPASWEEEGREVECPFEQPSSKRRRFCDLQATTPTAMMTMTTTTPTTTTSDIYEQEENMLMG